MKTFYKRRITLFFLIALFIAPCHLVAQDADNHSDLDHKVEKFLEKHKYRWHDMNIPTEDGKVLHDIIIKNNYKSALEIGTSTGHSAIWIAWALSKTGGKLITIEINESRYRKARANFREAGLEDYIDARLGDAHKLVPRLNQEFDMVFCDADKGWYKNYFRDVKRDIELNGCFIAHSISGPDNREAIEKFLDYIQNRSDFMTTIDHSGMSVSFKIK